MWHRRLPSVSLFSTNLPLNSPSGATMDATWLPWTAWSTNVVCVGEGTPPPLPASFAVSSSSSSHTASPVRTVAVKWFAPA